MVFDYDLQPGKKLWQRNLINDGVALVTIVTPYYNGSKYLEQTYNCVMNQTFPWFEWIIVDDGSTNLSDVEFLEKIAQKDSRVKVLHKENGGISSARNYGMNSAQTKYVVSLDCDDLIEPPYLEYCWWMLEKNPQAAWAYTDSIGFQNLEYMWKHRFDPVLLKTENHLTEVAMIRKDSWQDIGGYAELAKNYNEDWYLWLHFVAEGYFPVQSKNDFLSWYRRRDGGVLSIVEEENKVSDLNKKLISSMASKVIDPKKPIIFPDEHFETSRLVVSQWDKSIFKEHKKMHITLLTSSLGSDQTAQFTLDLSDKLDKDRFDLTILTLDVDEEECWQQKFRDITPDVFNLPNFMDPKDYAEFVSYILKSRETDAVMAVASDSAFGIFPWLRSNFPELLLIDWVNADEFSDQKDKSLMMKSYLQGITDRTYLCDADSILRFSNEIESLLSDEKLKETRLQTSQALKSFMGLWDDYFNTKLEENWMNVRISAIERNLQVYGETLANHEEVLNRHEEVVNRHEKVVNRHEEVVNRHEEVVNRHEKEINTHNTKINNIWRDQNKMYKEIHTSKWKKIISGLKK